MEKQIKVERERIVIDGGIDEETDPIFTNSPAHSITTQDINNWNNKSNFSGDYNDLSNKPTIPEELKDLSSDNLHRTVTDTEKQNWNNKSNFSGNYNDLSNKPTIPTELSELENDEGFITEEDIPPYVTELGSIDAEEYEDDVAMFMDTLTENGLYHFAWDNGDGYEYIIRVETIPSEDNSYINVNQHYWGTEEGSLVEYVRGIQIEDGEIIEENTTSYITLETASNTFANKSHVHYRTVQKAMSVWDFCVGSEISIQTNSPILYSDTRTPKHNWLIETTSAVSSPNNRFIRVTDLADASVMYQITGVYNAGRINWGSWYKFSGQVFTP